MGFFLRVWAVEDASDVIKSNSHSKPMSLGDLGAEGDEKGFDILPGDVGPCGLSEESIEGALVLSAHPQMIPNNGITIKDPLSGELRGYRPRQPHESF